MMESTIWRRLLLAVLAVCCAASAAAGSIQLVKDIDPYVYTSLKGSTPAPLGSGWVLSLCSAPDCLPFFTDGTSGNTRALPYQQPAGGEPMHFTAAGGKVFFLTSTREIALWVTDGTAAGNVKLTGVAFDSVGAPPVVLGTTVYFAVNGDQVWKSDGTPAGTALLVDLQQGAGASIELAAMGGALYILSPDGTGKTLWRSDGTSATLTAVGTFAAGALHLRTRAGKLFFDVANDGLWTSDGTSVGTQLLRATTRADLATGVVELGGKAYFVAADNPGSSTYSLWVTDATPAGTTAVQTWPSSVGDPAAAADWMLLPVYGAQFALWRSDGTTAGTQLNPSLNPYSFSFPIVAGNLVFFQDAAGLVWRSDGTDSGTSRITQEALFTPRAALGGRLLLERQTGGVGWLAYGYNAVAFVSDGTQAGTVPLVPSSGQPSNSSDCTNALGAVLGAYVFFPATDALRGCELWKSDGTEGGTTLVKDIYPGPYASIDFSLRLPLATAGPYVYFIASDDTHGTELWRTDGTDAGTLMVKDIVPGNGSPGNTLGYFTPVGSTLYFASLEPGASTSRMWKTDGTAAGTTVLRIPGTSTSPNTVSLVTAVGNSVFYVAQDDVGPALWKASTSTGVALVKRFTAFSGIRNPTAVGNQLFFIAAEPGAGDELWKSDGTDAGTVRATNLVPGPGGVVDVIVGTLGNSVIFGGRSPSTGLWRSDGTASGTVKIGNVTPVFNSLWPPVVSGGLLYFEDSSGALYRTDGTQAGTLKVKQFYYGLSRMMAVPGGVYFVGFDGVQGPYWWYSSGTPEGTVLIDNFPQNGMPSSDAPEVTAMLPTGLIFTTWATKSGNELYRIPFDAAPDPLSFPSLAGVLTNSRAESIPAQVLGINTLAAVSVAGGEVCVSSHNNACACDISPYGASTHVTVGQWLCVRHQAASTPSTTTTTLLIVGGTAATFSSTTGTSNPPTLRFDLASYEVDELGSILVGVDRWGDAQGAVSMDWSTLDITALAGTNYGVPGGSQPGGSLEWADGDLGTKYIRVGGTGADVALIDSGVWAPLRQFYLVFTGASAFISPGGATTTINITDTQKGFVMASSAISVAENAGGVLIPIRRRGDPSGSASVDFATSDSTAVAGTHYGAAAGTAFWAANDATTKTVLVSILDNNTMDGTRVFGMRLSNPVGIPLREPSFTQVSITDDDNTVQFSAPSATVSESASSVTLTVTRLGAASGPVSVGWNIAGSAIAGTDFGGSTSGTLSWPANDLTARTIVIPILNDSIPELPKSLVVSLVSPVNAKLGSPSTAMVTLNDDDAGVAFSAPSFLVSEAGGSVTLQVVRIGPTVGSASVHWAASAGSATAGLDFGTRGSSVLPSGTLTWRSGDAAPKTIVIPILQDALSEGPESFTVTLSGPVGVALATPSTATVVIADDELPPESRVSFTQPKVVVLESAGNAVLTLHRESIGGGFTVPATVSYATQAGTALAASDFTSSSGKVTWAASDAADKTITIPIVNDTVAEPAESFKVVLSAPSSGTQIGASEATVTILDNDEAFPAHGAVPGDWTIPAAANAGWHVSNEPGAYEGVYSLRSDAIGDGEVAQVEVTRTFVAGNVAFRLRVSSEPVFDKLHFFVDGVEKGTWSGTATTGWTLFSTPVTAGTHTLRWSYEKDGAISVGSDAAWIDAVTLP